MTNRPTYAPDRRPGDPADLQGAARELVVFTTTIEDAHTLASLLESGAAALKYAPLHATDVVELGARRRNYRLGSDAAKALRAEARRVHDRNESTRSKKPTRGGKS